MEGTGMKKIVVTGSNGQLGNELRDIDRGGRYAGRYAFLFTDVAELDITNREAVRRFMAAEQPAWIINAAAYTAVDKAEGDEGLAERLNADAVAYLAEAAREVGAGLVQVSTDYVFDGHKPADDHAWTEEEPTAPQSVYGRTKRRGEEYALAYGRSFVVRTAWLYSTYGNNFVKTMLRLGAERSELKVVNDQWGTPTYAADLAAALMRMVEVTDEAAAGQKEALYGLYHYTDEGLTTWCDFAREIMRLGGRPCTVGPITTAEYGAAAPRPEWSVLSKRKIRETFGVEVPEWEDSLKRCIGRLEAEK